MIAVDGVAAVVYRSGMSGLFPTRWRRGRPPSLEAFTAEFPDDYACADYLARKRWPDGFVCPHCGGRRAWRLEARPWIWQCGSAVVGEDGQRRICKRQTSLISGTVMHGTHLPLRKWFLGAFLTGTHSNGISALQLQAKLDVGYKTAWLLLQKLRRAMIDPDRRPLQGDVEVDETSIVYRTKDDPVVGGQGRSTVGKLFIIGAVEIKDRIYPGRIRLAAIPEIRREVLMPFVTSFTAPGVRLITDGNKSYLNPPDRGHLAKNLSAKNALPAHISMKWIHRVFSNLQRWAMGTYHGLRRKHLNAYLNEFVFRWNRRVHFDTTIDAMLRIGRAIGPLRYRDVVGDTFAWKKAHIREILGLMRPKKRDLVRQIAAIFRVSLVRAIDITNELIEAYRQGDASQAKALGIDLEILEALITPGPCYRRPSDRAVLPPRRPGEKRPTGRRYAKPLAPQIPLASRRPTVGVKPPARRSTTAN